MRPTPRHPPRIALLVALAASCVSFAAGCGGAKEAASPPQPPAAAMAEAAPAPAKLHETGGFADGRLASLQGQPATPGAPGPKTGTGSDAAHAPILIYTAQITMAVFEVNASLKKVESVARELGGFLAKSDDRSITIRVPSPAFDEAVKRIEGVGDVLHRNVTAEDVTEEFRDLDVRLKSARAVQQRLQELLAKAAKVEDSLAIEKELDRVTGEIERIEGRMKFLRDRAAFSTITVRFEPKQSEQVGEGSVRLPVPWLYDINLARLLRL